MHSKSIKHKTDVKWEVIKALEAFTLNDIDAHLDAVDALHAMGETEIANALVARFNSEKDMQEEKSRTVTSAYAEAQGYGATY